MLIQCCTYSAYRSVHGPLSVHGNIGLPRSNNFVMRSPLFAATSSPQACTPPQTTRKDQAGEKTRLIIDLFHVDISHVPSNAMRCCGRLSIRREVS